MASKDLVTSLQTSIDGALEILNKELISRTQWGEINFQVAELDLERAKNILDYLKLLPLDYLPDQAVTQIQTTANALKPILQKIDTFSLTGGAAPVPTRDGIVNEVHASVDKFYVAAAQWIPFLAYKKGDVEENIGKISSALNEAGQLYGKTKEDIKLKQDEIKKIIEVAREASASAGAAVFTKDFQEESDKNELNSSVWLIASMVCALVTVIAAIAFWILSYKIPTSDNFQTIQVVVSKFIIISILVTASVWCARNYRILKHLSSINRHRSLSLRTLQAFTHAASDDLTKNAVLIEATRAVFNSGGTGYIDGSDEKNNPAMFVEMVKNLNSGN